MSPPIDVKDEIEVHFHPKDTLKNTATTALQTTAAGTIIAGAVNTLKKQNVGPMGIITKSGWIIGLYATTGAAYQFTRDSCANLRGKEDAYNEFWGGFVGGSMIGIARRSFPFMAGAGVGLGVTLAAYRVTGGLGGFMKGKYADDEDRVEAKEKERKTYRRPLSETIELLGEGRGIYAPGYEERRRERLLAKYGVDVGPYQGQRT